MVLKKRQGPGFEEEHRRGFEKGQCLGFKTVEIPGSKEEQCLGANTKCMKHVQQVNEQCTQSERKVYINQVLVHKLYESCTTIKLLYANGTTCVRKPSSGSKVVRNVYTICKYIDDENKPARLPL